MNNWRIIDANINRASEGARVIEDITRFYYGNSDISEELKKLRHNVREILKENNSALLANRDPDNDCGFAISQKEISDKAEDHNEIILKNFKRLQEALRAIEENLKNAGYGTLAKSYEKRRFESYGIEKKLFFLIKKKDVLNTDIYAITGEKFSLGRVNIEIVSELIDAGVKIIQYREKEKDMIEKYKECIKIREITKDADVCFIVNDNIDLAIAAEADGVHIGQEDMPINVVRKLVGENMIIGLSTHSPAQAKNAVENKADYIGVGPIFATRTKKDVVAPVGYEYLDYVAENINIPFVVIGGIKEHNISEVAKKRAKCFAMITEIVGAENIGKKIANLRSVISEYQLL